MFGALSLSDQAGTAALAIYLFGHGGSASLSLLALRFFPPAAAGPLVPAALARLGVTRTLRGVPATRAALMMSASGAVAGHLPLWVIASVFGADMTVGQAFRPAVATALPSLSDSVEGVARASAALANAKSVGGFAGATIGSLTAATAGLAPACLLITALIAAPLPAVVRATAATAVFGGPPRVLRLRTAIGAVRTRAAIVSVVVGSMRTMLRGVWTGLVVLLATGAIGIGSRGVAVLALAAGAGGILSLGITGRLLAGRRLAPWLCGAIITAAGMTVLIATLPRLAVCVAALLVWGLALALADLSASTVIPRVVDHRSIAAVSAVNENAKLVMEGLGVFCAPALAILLGPRVALAVFASGVLVIIAISWPAARRAERDVAERMRTLDLLRSVNLFRGLRLDAIETLAAGAREVTCPAGRVLMTLGEPGDSYWILQSGSVFVHPLGLAPRRLGPGAGFGEIALLHDVPRTATVEAAEEITALVVDRESFLLAVTGASAVPEATGVPVESVGQDPDALILTAPTVAALGRARAVQAARRAARLELSADSIVFRAGEVADGIYVVLEGSVRIETPGQEKILGVGAEFGAIGARMTGTRTATVTTVEPCRLAVISAAELSSGPVGMETGVPRAGHDQV